MANPTTAKPTWGELAATAGTVGEHMLMFSPLTECPRDIVGNVLGVPSIGPLGHGTGRAPIYTTNAYTHGDVTNDPVYHFSAGSTAIVFPGRGFPTVGNGFTYPATFICEFRPRATRRASGSSARRYQSIDVWGTGGAGVHFSIGVLCYTPNDGTTPLTLSLGELWIGNFGDSTITLEDGKTYLVAMTMTSATGRIWNVYCRDDQAVVGSANTATTGFSYDPAMFGDASRCDAILNAGSKFNGDTVPAFVGDVYACGLAYDTYHTGTNNFFADLIADPCLAARGTYTAAGGLTAAATAVNFDATTTAIEIHSGRPTGGTKRGDTDSGYRYRLHRGTTANFTPGEGTVVAAWQASPRLLDTTATADSNYFYIVEQGDTTNTVYSTSQTTGRLSKGEIRLGIIADSRWAAGGIGEAVATTGRTLCVLLRSMGWRAGAINRAESSSGVKSATAGLSWQPNTTQDPVNGQANTYLLRDALAEFTNAGVTHVFDELGVNDLGTYTAAEWTTLHGYIVTRTLAAGMKHVLYPPFFSSVSGAYTGRLDEYATALAGMANGSTILYAGRASLDMSMDSMDLFSADGLHMLWPHADGSRAAISILESVLEPERTAAYQLADDVAAVTAVKASINDDITLLGVDGTQSISGIEAAAAAAQLATDRAEVNSNVDEIWYGQTVLTGSNAGTKRASTITNCEAANIIAGVTIDNVTGTALSASALWSMPVNSLVTAGSIGERLASFMGPLSYTAPPAANVIASATWTSATSGLTGAGSIGKYLMDGLLQAAGVTGDVGGKVLGGGAGTITGTGVRAVDGSGAALATAAAVAAIPTTAGSDWSDTERSQIRYRLNLDGTKAEPVGTTPDPITITPPTGPGKTTGYCVVLDENGDPKGGVEISVRLSAGPGTAGYSYLKGGLMTATSAAGTGLAQFPDLVQSAEYEVQRPDGAWVAFTAGTGATTAITECYGGAEDP